MALLVGCANESDVAGDVAATTGDAIATVDGRPITAEMLQHYARSRAQRGVEQLTPEEHEALLDELIRLRLIATAAETTGVLQEQALVAELEFQRLQTVARRMISAHLDENPVSDAELRQAYDENQEQLAGTQYKARHILVDEESEAIEIIELLKQGADFQELARTRSTGPSGPNGGDLDWFEADRMVPPFADAVRAMEVGTFSQQPVQTRFGWHVILLEDESDQQAPAMEAVKDNLTTIVEQTKVQAYLDDLEARAYITL
jgi:peptidyl-prolyl cis-trans isomerase C